MPSTQTASCLVVYVRRVKFVRFVGRTRVVMSGNRR